MGVNHPGPVGRKTLKQAAWKVFNTPARLHEQDKLVFAHSVSGLEVGVNRQGVFLLRGPLLCAFSRRVCHTATVLVV